MTTLNLGGMQSISLLTGGIDYSQIIQQLDKANRAPGDALNQVLQTDQLKSNDWANVAKLASTLQNDLVTLAGSSTFSAYTSTLSGTDAANFTATAGANASPGTYNISVTQPLVYGALTSGGQIGAAVNISSTSVTSDVFSQSVSAGTTISAMVGNVSHSYTIQTGDTISSIFNNLFGSGVSLSQAAGSDTFTLTNSTGSTISFGTAGDTSKLFSALGLAGQSVANSGTLTSGTMGHAQLSETLNNGNFATAFSTSGAGTISINGVNISYNTTVDTLQQVINRINSSNAGVTASYDAINDKFTLTSKTSQAVSVTDVTNNLGQVLGLTASTSPNITTGQNLKGTVNGSAFSSQSATLSNIIPGVTIDASAPSSAFSATKTSLDTTVTVAQDNSALTKNVNKFVNDFNSLYHQLQLYTQKGGDLQGDGAIAQLAFQYMNDVLSPVQVSSSYPQNSVMGIGISNGAIGSTPGTTNSLQVDANNLTQAFSDNPSEVRDILTGMATKLNQDLVNLTGNFNTLEPISASNKNMVGLAKTQENMYSDMIKRTQAQQQSIYNEADQEAQQMQAEFTQLQQYQQQSAVQMNMVKAMSGGLLG